MDIHLFFAILNFAIFVGLLSFLLRRPLKEFWGNRAESLRARIAAARKRRSEAQEEYERLEGRVKHLEQEMQQLRQTMRQNGELEKEKIIENAKAYAARLTEGAKRVAQQDLSKAIFRLRQSTARTTIDLAERTIRERITENDHERLASDYIDHLASEGDNLSGGLA